jgi:hypothetical protein
MQFNWHPGSSYRPPDPPKEKSEKPKRPRSPSSLALPATILGVLFAGASFASGVCTVGELSTGPRERYMLGLFAWACIIFAAIAVLLFCVANWLSRRR